MSQPNHTRNFQMFQMLRLPFNLFLLLAVAVAGPAHALDKVRFATNWKAQAAHGGFYQAIADGTYKRYGLDVTLIQGGPQIIQKPI